MASRRQFVQTASLLSAGLFLDKTKAFALPGNAFISNRPPLAQRKFTSKAVEAMIEKVKKDLPNKELGWLFENCFPNTLDTTVDFEIIDGKPDTYVITGDIDAMCLLDITAKVCPYIPFTKKNPKQNKLINREFNEHIK